MKKIVIRGCIVLLSLLTIAILLQNSIRAQEETIKAEELAEDLGKYLGEVSVFRDTVAFVYKDTTEFEREDSFLKFDTYHIRCRIKVTETSDKEQLKRWSRGEVDDPATDEQFNFKESRLALLKELYFTEIEPRPVILTGKVVQLDEFGYSHIFEVDEINRVTYTINTGSE